MAFNKCSVVMNNTKIVGELAQGSLIEEENSLQIFQKAEDAQENSICTWNTSLLRFTDSNVSITSSAFTSSSITPLYFSGGIQELNHTEFSNNRDPYWETSGYPSARHNVICKNNGKLTINDMKQTDKANSTRKIGLWIDGENCSIDGIDFSERMFVKFNPFLKAAALSLTDGKKKTHQRSSALMKVSNSQISQKNELAQKKSQMIPGKQFQEAVSEQDAEPEVMAKGTIRIEGLELLPCHISLELLRVDNHTQTYRKPFQFDSSMNESFATVSDVPLLLFEDSFDEGGKKRKKNGPKWFVCVAIEISPTVKGEEAQLLQMGDSNSERDYSFSSTSMLSASIPSLQSKYSPFFKHDLLSSRLIRSNTIELNISVLFTDDSDSGKKKKHPLTASNLLAVCIVTASIMTVGIVSVACLLHKNHKKKKIAAFTKDVEEENENATLDEENMHGIASNHSNKSKKVKSIEVDQKDKKKAKYVLLEEEEATAEK
eukprot:MONOS_6469.1-p1 / transcript=MONOS_6469.1 / gene=MONOS_6469 / organism=Monocercomonoides_exilis_PA203 / gene_product=unspecified product / transcript_product=unspecified product / location=Mono_scaffold00204:5917-7380(-) / protein_length=488 / sequence_SO=supercontig / SO=protein_coding / is_pseudo=false